MNKSKLAGKGCYVELAQMQYVCSFIIENEENNFYFDVGHRL